MEKRKGKEEEREERESKRRKYDFNKERAIKACEKGEWIVEDVVNFYVSLLEEQLEKNGDGRFILFNSFFWPMLKEDKDNAKRLVNWIKKDLWTAEYWIIPMYSDSHWFLCVVKLPADLVTCKRLHVYFMDSLVVQNIRAICKKLRYFIAASWMLKNPGKECPRQVQLIPKQLNVPKQTNGCDCGFFMLQYIKLFTKKPIHEDSPNWFSIKTISTLRERLRGAINYIKE